MGFGGGCSLAWLHLASLPGGRAGDGEEEKYGYGEESDGGGAVRLTLAATTAVPGWLPGCFGLVGESFLSKLSMGGCLYYTVHSGSR